MRRYGWAALVSFVATVYAANWLLNTFGMVPVGFGLEAPAGVFAAGAALCFRDAVQELLGRWWVAFGIVAGCVLSFLLGANAAIPGGHVTIALASAVAFLTSELADFGVYTPLRERTLMGGLVASNVAAAVVDSALFLWLAFGSLAFMQGQIVGKLEMTIPAVLFLTARKARTA